MGYSDVTGIFKRLRLPGTKSFDFDMRFLNNFLFPRIIPLGDFRVRGRTTAVFRRETVASVRLPAGPRRLSPRSTV